jgi:hypothetical protein
VAAARVDERRVEGEGAEEEVDGLGGTRFDGAGIGIVGRTGDEAASHGAQRVELVGREEAARLTGRRGGGEQGAHARRRSEGEDPQTAGGLQEGAPVHAGEGT